MVVRVDKPTPNGGAYSLGFYATEKGEDCTPETATIIHIHEYTADDEFICETFGFCNQGGPE